MAGSSLTLDAARAHSLNARHTMPLVRARLAALRPRMYGTRSAVGTRSRTAIPRQMSARARTRRPLWVPCELGRDRLRAAAALFELKMFEKRYPREGFRQWLSAERYRKLPKGAE